MRTETVTRTIYSFDELPNDTQAFIISHWREHDEFWAGGEIVDSLKGFCRHFNVTLHDYLIGHDRSWGIRVSHNEDYGDVDVSSLTGARLWKWLNNNGYFDEKVVGGNCPFTGVCFDEDLLGPIRDIKADPHAYSGLDDLLQACVDQAQHAFTRELDYWHSDEAIREDIIANDYEFYENGSIV